MMIWIHFDCDCIRYIFPHVNCICPNAGVIHLSMYNYLLLVEFSSGHMKIRFSRIPNHIAQNLPNTCSYRLSSFLITNTSKSTLIVLPSDPPPILTGVHSDFFFFWKRFLPATNHWFPTLSHPFQNSQGSLF